MMMMMFDVLRPPLCTWYAKWAERPPKVMERKKAKDETIFRYPHAEIRTRVVVIIIIIIIIIIIMYI